MLLLRAQAASTIGPSRPVDSLSPNTEGWPVSMLPVNCLARLISPWGLTSIVLLILQGCQDASPKDTNEARAPTRGVECAVSPRAAPDDALKGTTTSGELWAIGGVPSVGEEYKIVIRETGSGKLTVYALGPSDSRLHPFDIVEHSSSNFERPGDEWGVFFKFDHAGCWTIFAKRVGAEGRIMVLVKK